MVCCELCNGEAFVYCGSDSAYLCWNCDARVHGANFLAARHVRRTICSRCKSKPSSSSNNNDSARVSGSGHQYQFLINHRRLQIPFCSCDIDAFSLRSSSSSSCISSTDDTDDGDASSFGFQYIRTSNPEDPNNDVITHPNPSFCANYSGILVNWCKELGAGAGLPALLIDQMVRNASGIMIPDDTLPCRVGLAASVWFSLMRSRRRRRRSRRTTSAWRDLKKLEEVSGVPAKLIVAAEIKLANLLRVMRQRRHQQRAEDEEGWAEC